MQYTVTMILETQKRAIELEKIFEEMMIYIKHYLLKQYLDRSHIFSYCLLPPSYQWNVLKELSPVLSSQLVLSSSSQTFAPNISPQNALLRSTSDLLFAKFSGRFLVLILLDLVAAYKIVDHSLLFF